MADDIMEASKSDDSSKGLDSLYVPVMAPDQIEKVLQFQWMRVHPSTAISLCEDEDSSAVQVSRMASAYQAAMVSSQPEKAITSPFLRARGICIDLCDLFDPPLLSEHYLSTASVQESRTVVPKRMRQENSADAVQEAPSPDQVFVHVLDLAMAELGNERHALVNIDLQGYLSTISGDSLVEALPTHLVREKINQLASDKSASFAQLSLTVMVLLSEHAACDSIGRYVLRTLAPALLCTAEASSDEQETLSPLLSRLADALVSRCSLGKLSKEELSCMVSTTYRMHESEAMDELVLCISEAYYRLDNSP